MSGGLCMHRIRVTGKKSGKGKGVRAQARKLVIIDYSRVQCYFRAWNKQTNTQWNGHQRAVDGH